VTGAELERAVAAALQSSGWFILRGASDETFQAFELDVLGYRFTDGREESVMVEAKGGKSGFSDLWKLVGLKTHLNVGAGVLLADDSEPLHDRKVILARKHNISVIAQDDVGLPEALAEVDVIDSLPESEVLAVWQRCFRIEDALIKILNDRDLWQQWSTIRIAKQQLQHLASKAWLEPDPWRQAVRLYRLFQEHPKIARRMANEMAPGQTDIAYNEALYHGSIEEILACFYLEHRKRLTVTFSATRCAAFEGDSRYERLAPGSFRAMVDTIASENAWYLPALLQVYFYGFGGMVCLDEPDLEYDAMALQAGCTRQQVQRALTLFAELFSTPNGWFHERNELSLLKLVPVQIRAGGCWMREAVYGRPWSELATVDQLKAIPQGHLRKAANLEQSVLTRPRRSLSGRRRQKER